MLRKKQARGIMWAAAVAMAFAATVSWWTAVDGGATVADLIAPIGFTVAALIWLANVLVANYVAKASGGDTR